MQPRPDEHSVLAVEAAYDAAWNEGDVDGLVRCFTEDAVLVNPHGEVDGEARRRVRDHVPALERARGTHHH